MEPFSHRVEREALQPGDHIYSWRNAYTFAHHGIYAGGGEVIHFTGGRNEELAGSATFSSAFTSSSTPGRSTTTPCEVCGTDAESRGVLKSCLNCFLSGFPLFRFEYSTSIATFLAKVRGGTCTTAKSDPAQLVLHRANHLLNNNCFGSYDVFRKNCEDFAIYCKTGLLVIDRNAIGASGQAISMLGVLGAVSSIPSGFRRPYFWSLVAAFGAYSMSRYMADIGVRSDVEKVDVEDLALNRSGHRLQGIR